MTWYDVAKRRTLLDFSSMNDFGEDVVTSSSVEYGRFQLGLFLSGVLSSLYTCTQNFYTTCESNECITVVITKD